jgi:CTP:molybdopterin cytidylyltransferase MocA
VCDTRRLTSRELDAIRVGLRMLLDADANDPLLTGARAFEDVEALLGDREIVDLIGELSLTAVEVSVRRIRLAELVASALARNV